MLLAEAAGSTHRALDTVLLQNVTARSGPIGPQHTTSPSVPLQANDKSLVPLRPQCTYFLRCTSTSSCPLIPVL